MSEGSGSDGTGCRARRELSLGQARAVDTAEVCRPHRGRLCREPGLPSREDKVQFASSDEPRGYTEDAEGDWREEEQ